MIVLDASLALAGAHTDRERTDAVLAVLDRVVEHGAIAPSMWPIEVANGLEMALRRKRISIPERDELFASFRRFPVEVELADRDIVWGAVVGLAHRHSLTVYDATYLELAIRHRLPLATLDKELIAAARAEGVPVLP